MSITVLDHPLLADRLTRLRDRTTPMVDFHATLRECGRLMAYPVLQTLRCQPHAVETPLAPFMGVRIVPPVLVGILRAALPLLAGFHDAVPEAAIGHLGLMRDHDTLAPIEYLVKLPNLSGCDIILLDPMLATGGSMAHGMDILVKNGADPARVTAVSVLAAPEGVAAVAKRHPAIKIVTAALDERLNANAYIVPGLGDAGDRAFGTQG